MQQITYFADVIVPLGVPNKYTYRVPFDLNKEVEIGKRVLVQFGKTKIYRIFSVTPVINETFIILSALFRWNFHLVDKLMGMSWKTDKFQLPAHGQLFHNINLHIFRENCKEVTELLILDDEEYPKDSILNF